MDDAEFWSLIELIDGHALDACDEGAAVAPLEAAATHLSEDALIAFNRILEEKLDALDTRRHRRAAGDAGESDDLFLYARAYVVARGRSFFEDVRMRPRLLPLEDYSCELLLMVAPEVFRAKTGRDMPESEPNRHKRPLQQFRFYPEGSERQNVRFNFLQQRIQHELVQGATPPVLVPFNLLNLMFRAGEGPSGTASHAFALESIAHLHSAAVVSAESVHATEPEFISAVFAVLDAERGLAREKLRFDIAPLLEIVDRIRAGGIACRFRIPKWARTWKRERRRVAFDWVLREDTSVIMAIVEDPESSERLFETELIRSQSHQAWDCMIVRGGRLRAQHDAAEVIAPGGAVEHSVALP